MDCLCGGLYRSPRVYRRRRTRWKVLKWEDSTLEELFRFALQVEAVDVALLLVLRAPSI